METRETNFVCSFLFRRGVNSPVPVGPSAEADGRLVLSALTGWDTGFACFSRRANGAAEFTLSRISSTYRLRPNSSGYVQHRR